MTLALGIQYLEYCDGIAVDRRCPDSQIGSGNTLENYEKWRDWVRMLARIDRIEKNGLVLTILNGPFLDRRAWLSSEQWGDTSDSWGRDVNGIELGSELDVVDVPPIDHSQNELIVSRSAFRDEHVDKGWLHQSKLMEVTEITRALIRGKIGAVTAVISLQEYMTFVERKANLSQSLIDFSVLGEGDRLAGIVREIDSEHARVKLSVIDSLDILASELDNTAASVHATSSFSTTDVVQALAPALQADIVRSISPVVVIENDNGLRESIEGFLRSNGATVLSARSYEETMQFLLSRPSTDSQDLEYKLAIIDPNLEPSQDDLRGLQLAELIRQKGQCKILVMSGEISNERKKLQWGDLLINAYLQKPFMTLDLVETIEEAVASDPAPLSKWLSSSQEPPPMSASDDFWNTTPQRESLSQAIITHLRDLAVGRLGISLNVFTFHPRSMRAWSIASFGSQLNWHPYRGKLRKSPIKDVAFGVAKSTVHRDCLTRPNHLWTRQMLTYDSFVGGRLDVATYNRYCLVAFAPNSVQVDQAFVVAFELCRERISRAIERDLARSTHRVKSNWVAKGMAFASLSHELDTKLSTQGHQIDQILAAGNRLGSSPIEAMQDVVMWASKLQETVRTSQDISKVLRASDTQLQKTDVIHCLHVAAIGCTQQRQEIVSKTVQLRIDIPDRNLSISRDFPCPYFVHSNPVALTIVFFNLYLNAAQQIALMSGIRKSGHIWHSCELRTDRMGQQWLLVRIHDSGPGIHREDWERAFEPGFSTKPFGSGLGLDICRHLLSEIRIGHRKATIEITNSVLWQGSTFTVKFPIVPDTGNEET